MSNLTLRIDEHVTMTGHIMSYYQIGKAHFYGETVPVDWYLLYDAGDAQAVEPGDCGDCESITLMLFFRLTVRMSGEAYVMRKPILRYALIGASLLQEGKAFRFGILSLQSV